jgi:hypothetical protein
MVSLLVVLSAHRRVAPIGPKHLEVCSPPL